jgi:hypothetical protein
MPKSAKNPGTPTPKIRYALPFPLIPPDGLIWGDGLIRYSARPLGQAA